MHQTKKGNQWHFGMKAHIGVDSETVIVHSMSTTAANVHDITETPHLRHGGEAVVWGDAGYQGVHKREDNMALEVEWRGRCGQGSDGSWSRTAMRRGGRRPSCR